MARPPVMLTRRLILVGFACLSAPGIASEVPWQWVDKNVFKRISLSGRRVLGYHAQSVEGDREAFKSLTYAGSGSEKFTDTGHVTVDGRKVFGLFNFQFQFVGNRFNDPEGQRLSLEYERGPIGVHMGDIRGSLHNTNSLASFNRSLRGVSASYGAGRLAIKGVHSEAKGSATTISIQGDNSVGPYYLRTSRIAKDTVQVRVDGAEVKLQDDYTVNYELGAITFTERIIPPTSTIVVTYEGLSAGSSQGILQGASATYDMGRFGKVGLTAIEQKPSASRGLSSRTDLFQGFGDPSTPYFLTFEPMRTRPIIVKLQGVIQVEGVHYRFDPTNPAILYFLFPVPSTSNIDVTYTPKPTPTLEGERRVIGIDYRLPLGKHGHLDFNQATGSLTNDSNPMRGTARTLDASYDLRGLQLRASVKDVPNSFVGIESRGFLRNERSMEFALDSTSGPLKYGLSTTNSVIGSRVGLDPATSQFHNLRSTQLKGHLSYSTDPKSTWRLERTRTTSRNLQGESQLESTNLSGSYRFGKLQTSLGMERTDGRAPLADGGKKSLSLDTLRFGASYDAGSAWSLSSRFGLSNVKTSDDDGKGTDLSVGVAYRPGGRFSLEMSHAQSKSGALSALAGFQNGSGLGYGGNGFTGGIASPGLGPTVGSNYVATNIAATYRLSPKINLAARATNSQSAGSVSSNSNSKTLALDLDWDLGRAHATGLSVSRSNTRFLGSQNRSESTNLDWFLHGSPSGPWSYRLGATMLLTGGGSEFAQDSFGFDGSLTHRIDERQRASFSFHAGRTNGYLPQTDAFAGLFYDYRIFENVSLVSSYKWRLLKNLDPSVTSGGYRSSGFDIELAFDFAP